MLPKTPLSVLVEQQVLVQAQDTMALSRFIDKAFLLAGRLGQPVAVQEVDGCLVCRQGRPTAEASFVTFLLPSEELMAGAA